MKELENLLNFLIENPYAYFDSESYGLLWKLHEFSLNYFNHPLELKNSYISINFPVYNES